MKTIYLSQFRFKRTGCDGTLQIFQEGEVYFTEEKDARMAVDVEKRVNHRDSLLIAEPHAVKVYESIDEYQKIVDERLRKKALAKLSSAEKQILGLPEN